MEKTEDRTRAVHISTAWSDGWWAGRRWRKATPRERAAAALAGTDWATDVEFTRRYGWNPTDWPEGACIYDSNGVLMIWTATRADEE